jgi:hypothetical protein
MSGSLTARLKDRRFIQAFHRLFEEFHVELIVKLISGSLTARLKDQRFMQAFTRLFEKILNPAALNVQATTQVPKIPLTQDHRRFTCSPGTPVWRSPDI